MLGPTTCAVEKRGSSTVNCPASRITSMHRSRRVTSQPSRAGTHETGALSRSRASDAYGSLSSWFAVSSAPIGNSRRPLIGCCCASSIASFGGIRVSPCPRLVHIGAELVDTLPHSSRQFVDNSVDRRADLNLPFVLPEG